jgi:hypothetical protein
MNNSKKKLRTISFTIILKWIKHLGLD